MDIKVKTDYFLDMLTKFWKHQRTIMKVLKKLLGTQDTDLFLTKYFSRLPFASQGGGEDFKGILKWSDINDIVKTKKSHLRIVQNGRMIKDYADLNNEEVLNYYKNGNTILIKNAELSHALCKALANDFSSSFFTPVDIQLYCTPEGHNAFGWHYDVEEVFIIQTQGSKAYTIRQNTIHPNPLVSSIPKDLGYEMEKSDLEISVTLKEGDWLYIPSGWWHIAKTQEESMHISIGLMPRSAIDFLSYLQKDLASSPYWRIRMPVHKQFSSTKEEVDFYQEAIGQLGQDILRRISEPRFVEDFLKSTKENFS